LPGPVCGRSTIIGHHLSIAAPMGVVDEYRIPKAVFYLFRKQWTGKASETPVPGLTPTKLRLDSDMSSLIADSTDIAIITASFRTAGDTCVIQNRARPIPSP